MKNVLLRHKRLIIVAFIFTILLNAATVGYAFVFQRMVDYIIMLDVKSAVIAIAVQIGVFFAISFFGFMVVFFRGKYLQKTLAYLKALLFFNYINTDFIEFRKRSEGDYLNALSTWVNDTNNQFILPIYRGIGSILLAFGSLVAIFYLNPLMGGLAVALLFGQISIPFLRRRQTKKTSEKYATDTSKFSGIAADLLKGFMHIASLSVFSLMNEKFAKANEELEQSRFKMNTVIALSDNIIYFVRSILILLPWFIGVILIARGQMSFGAMMAISQLNNSLAEPLGDAISYFNQALAGREIARKLNHDLLELLPVSKKPIALAEPFDSIRLDGISFSYDDNRTVLNDVSFTFKAGKKYALLGKSGSGKSTLCKILGGIITSFEGSFYINEKRVESASDNLSGILGYCPQDTHIFDDTIYNNITLYRDTTTEEVNAVLKQLGLSDFINSLSDGPDTMLGSSGIQLSGGQMQRIGLARVLINRTPVLVLDEVSSSLDLELYNEIENLIVSLKGITVISVSHRPESSIINKYDVVITMPHD